MKQCASTLFCTMVAFHSLTSENLARRRTSRINCNVGVGAPRPRSRWCCSWSDPEPARLLELDVAPTRRHGYRDDDGNDGSEDAGRSGTAAEVAFASRLSPERRHGGTTRIACIGEDLRVRVLPLRIYSLPDVGDYLIHFTGRNGPRRNVDPEIVALSPEERMRRILGMRRICAFTTFGAGAPVAAFTESTQASVTRLIADERYAPFGIGFSKQFVFDKSGGPVLYLRGDEWNQRHLFPQPIRSRLVRFWPGAEPEAGEILDEGVASKSEWLHEREWRVPGDMSFAWGDVKFLIVPTLDWQHREAQTYDWVSEEYPAAFAAMPVVVIDAAGHLLHDDTGIWGR
jgi:hypothetical protein